MVFSKRISSTISTTFGINQLVAKIAKSINISEENSQVQKFYYKLHTASVSSALVERLFSSTGAELTGCLS